MKIRANFIFTLRNAQWLILVWKLDEFEFNELTTDRKKKYMCVTSILLRSIRCRWEALSGLSMRKGKCLRAKWWRNFPAGKFHNRTHPIFRCNNLVPYHKIKYKKIIIIAENLNIILDRFGASFFPWLNKWNATQGAQTDAVYFILFSFYNLKWQKMFYVWRRRLNMCNFLNGAPGSRQQVCFEFALFCSHFFVVSLK